VLGARDSAVDLWLSGARLEKAVGRQGGVDAAASRWNWPRQGVARIEISDVQTLSFWLGNRGGAVSKRCCQPYWMLNMGWTIDFSGRILTLC